ncbi:transcription termination factor 1-like isoform X2 [Polypterus senegalus]|nr:transcription termination factor 1-like isoform X2 [Polypterus senegalus]XP_039620226.1 transcription termination factor 1-like isoform X2 [Polypterus senegalus]XP_039620227.1 transcription termination factor 1-like isoform X2 [Polypterus senegalus]
MSTDSDGKTTSGKKHKKKEFKNKAAQEMLEHEDDNVDYSPSGLIQSKKKLKKHKHALEEHAEESLFQDEMPENLQKVETCLDYDGAEACDPSNKLSRSKKRKKLKGAESEECSSTDIPLYDTQDEMWRTFALHTPIQKKKKKNTSPDVLEKEADDYLMTPLSHKKKKSVQKLAEESSLTDETSRKKLKSRAQDVALDVTYDTHLGPAFIIEKDESCSVSRFKEKKKRKASSELSLSFLEEKEADGPSFLNQVSKKKKASRESSESQPENEEPSTAGGLSNSENDDTVTVQKATNKREMTTMHTSKWKFIVQSSDEDTWDSEMGDCSPPYFKKTGRKAELHRSCNLARDTSMEEACEITPAQREQNQSPVLDKTKKKQGAAGLNSVVTPHKSVTPVPSEINYAETSRNKERLTSELNGSEVEFEPSSCGSIKKSRLSHKNVSGGNITENSEVLESTQNGETLTARKAKKTKAKRTSAVETESQGEFCMSDDSWNSSSFTSNQIQAENSKNEVQIYKGHPGHSASMSLIQALKASTPKRSKTSRTCHNKRHQQQIADTSNQNHEEPMFDNAADSSPLAGPVVNNKRKRRTKSKGDEDSSGIVKCQSGTQSIPAHSENKESSNEDMRPDDVIRQLEKFVPNVHKLSTGVIHRMAKNDLERFKQFHEKGIPIRSGKFSKEENERLQANVNEFMKITGISDAEKLFYPLRYPEEFTDIRKLKKEHNFIVSIGEGIPRSSQVIYDRGRKMFDSLSYKGKFTKQETDDLVRYHNLHGNNWSKIAPLIGRSEHSLNRKWSRIKKHRSGQWNYSERQCLIKAVKSQLTNKLNESSVEDKGQEQMASLKQNKLNSINREDLYRNISWENVASKVKTRTSLQCRNKWLSLLRFKMTKERDVCYGIRGVQARINIIQILYEKNLKDHSEINWEELADAIGDVPPSYVQNKFSRLKTTKVPDYSKKTFPEVINHLYAHTLPYLENKLQKLENRYGPKHQEQHKRTLSYTLCEIFPNSDDEDST